MIPYLLAYTPNEFKNFLVERILLVWEKNEEKKGIANSLLPLYKHSIFSNKIFLRIVLAFFTFFLGASFTGIFSLFFSAFDPDFTGIGVISLIFGFIFLSFLEIAIRTKKMYQSGIDDMLLYMSYMANATGISILIFESKLNDSTSFSIAMFIFGVITLIGSIRYVDMVSALLSIGNFIGVICILFQNNLSFLPFTVAIVGGLLYWALNKWKKNEHSFYWSNIIWISEIVSLLLFYLSLNYFVVRTLTEELLYSDYYYAGIEIPSNIPFAWLFYGTTAIIPFVYIYWGIKSKNKVLLRVGLLLIAASVLTFKYYFSTGHHEISLTVGGALLLGFCYWLHKWLSTDKLGLSLKKDTTSESYFDSEALLIAQNFRIPQQDNSNNGTQLGDGKFGGGGSSSDF